ncbi:uncharacterized protein LOC126838942 isoform X2 [Adelges cooleyi]|uniref:uncharacterized protein LOC126838942 isoform X2 n=1 Tax=Adelges cooleyi TaxID=133065 RepID=UPI00217F3029|nr:uncharacterized protein LOC126838942 isoform X2 [Adelges cooleyi]
MMVYTYCLPRGVVLHSGTSDYVESFFKSRSMTALSSNRVFTGKINRVRFSVRRKSTPTSSPNSQTLSTVCFTLHLNRASDGPKESRSIVSPRMDFDEWTPLGRGDPLKNDPTFDYLPPALEKVHYWKPPPPPPSSLATNQRAYSAVLSTAAAPVSAIHYNNRRFFLTDYPSKAAEGTYYLHKRPAPQVVVSGGFHYSVPRTPLPMLTPPPYSRPSTSLVPAAPTTARPAAAATDIGTSLAESRHPPPAAVRAPPTLTTVPGVVRPPLPASTSAIKVLLEKEIDRTTVTTAETPVRATGATAKMSAVTDPPPSLPSWPSPHGQPAAVARPMYLIIQGHSKVKTYGLATKPDDVLDRTAGVADHDHNRLDDDPSRRKRHSQ